MELDGEAPSWSSAGIESLDTDPREKGDSCSDSLPGDSLSFSSSGGLSKMSRGELIALFIKSSSFDLMSSFSIRLNSSTWFPRGTFRGLRVDHDRRGTGIAVALSIEATEMGMFRSFDEEDDDERRDDADVLAEGRERGSRWTEA
jgi:hypothetical protein